MVPKNFKWFEKKIFGDVQVMFLLNMVGFYNPIRGPSRSSTTAVTPKEVTKQNK